MKGCDRNDIQNNTQAWAGTMINTDIVAVSAKPHIACSCSSSKYDHWIGWKGLKNWDIQSLFPALGIETKISTFSSSKFGFLKSPFVDAGLSDAG